VRARLRAEPERRPARVRRGAARRLPHCMRGHCYVTAARVTSFRSTRPTLGSTSCTTSAPLSTTTSQSCAAMPRRALSPACGPCLLADCGACGARSGAEVSGGAESGCTACVRLHGVCPAAQPASSCAASVQLRSAPVAEPLSRRPATADGLTLRALAIARRIRGRALCENRRPRFASPTRAFTTRRPGCATEQPARQRLPRGGGLRYCHCQSMVSGRWHCQAAYWEHTYLRVVKSCNSCYSYIESQRVSVCYIESHLL
jgi:hypothetical protein